MNLDYHWQRFWIPRSVMDLSLKRTYSASWEDLESSSIRSYEVLFESLFNIPCLVLLGEAGIGKTHALKEAQLFTESRSIDTLWFELGGYQSDELLSKDLFGDSTFQHWLHGTHDLHLFLDSFDEGQLTIRVLTTLLTRSFKKYCKHLNRLSLRITCRPAEWTGTLEQNLKELWGEERVGIYQMAPLHLANITEAAIVNELENPNTFLQAVEQKGAIPLAIKPLTLDFLLKIYQEKGTFPSAQSKIYTEGCELLCKTIGKFRRNAGFIGTLNVGSGGNGNAFVIQ